MPKSNYIQIRMTDEMKERIKEMSDKKSLTMTSLIQIYIANGLQTDELSIQINSKDNVNNLLKDIAPKFIDNLKINNE